MTHSEASWRSEDGLKIFSRYWKPDGEPKALVCLVHGVGEHSGRYGHVAEAFCEKGYVLYTFDQRGHGLSEGPRGHYPLMEIVLKDIDLLLKNAGEKFPGLPVFLYGHSLGGLLALHYSLKRKPMFLSGVIATSPGLKTSLQEQPVKIFAAKVLGSIMPKLSINSGLDVNGISRDRSVIDAYLKDPLVHSKMSLGFGKVMIGVLDWTMQHADEFCLPLLLMHGRSDKITYYTGSEAFASKVNDCEWVLFEDGFHELHNEPFKEQVFNVMFNFIKDKLLY